MTCRGDGDTASQCGSVNLWWEDYRGAQNAHVLTTMGRMARPMARGYAQLRSRRCKVSGEHHAACGDVATTREGVDDEHGMGGGDPSRRACSWRRSVTAMGGDGYSALWFAPKWRVDSSGEYVTLHASEQRAVGRMG